MGISNLICKHGSSTGNNLDVNPYLCEVGTFLSMRARVRQMQASGTLMYEYRRKLAQMQNLDDRFIDDDPELNEETFEEMDEIDKFNVTCDLSDKLSQSAQNALKSDVDSKNTTEDENASDNASESVSEDNSEPEKV